MSRTLTPEEIAMIEREYVYIERIAQAARSKESIMRSICLHALVKTVNSMGTAKPLTMKEREAIWKKMYDEQKATTDT